MKRVLRWARVMAVMLGAGAVLAAVAGCDSEDHYKNPDAGGGRVALRDAPSSDPSPPTGADLLYGGKQPGSMAQAMGADAALGHPKVDDHDYVQKADIYWKFNAIQANFTSGVEQRDLATQLDKIEQQARTLNPDSNLRLIQDLLRLYRSAAQAQHTNADLKGHGVDPGAVTWGVGEMSMQDSFRRQRPSTWGSGSKTYVPPSQREKQQMVLDYERDHHASPEQVRSFAFTQAAPMARQLGQNLGLLNRKANSPTGAVTVD